MLKRTKRSTAGNRYRQALANDLDDQEKEFFSTTYGGFAEENDDDDFRSSSSDTDDSIDDSRSEESDGDAPGEEPEKEKKKRKLVYREPRNKLTGVKQIKKKRTLTKQTTNFENLETRKSSRQTTIDQRQDADDYIPEKESRKRPIKKQRQMTQEQLLKAAMEMEEINLSQLVIYQQEEQQRKSKVKRKKAKTICGPTIKTVSRVRPLESHSESNHQKIAAPMIEEVSNLIPEHQKKVNIRIDHFLIFSDQETFESSFPKSRAIEKVPTLCRVTGKPARYRTHDGIPYYDSYAFKVLRERAEKLTPSNSILNSKTA